jgi:hypothetical protein
MRTKSKDPERGERRQLPRHHCDVAPWVALVGESLQGGMIRDISPAGIGLLLEHEVDPRKRIRIELPCKTGTLWHLKALDVIHATPRQEAGWIVGGVFPSPLTDDQLQALLT